MILARCLAVSPVSKEQIRHPLTEHESVTLMAAYDMEAKAGIETADDVAALRTEIKRLEKALAEREAHISSLVRNIPDLVWLKDENGIYLNCNLAFENFFGAPEKEIVGKTDYDFVDKDLADFFRSNDRAAMLANKARTNEEWVTLAASGQRVLLETIKTPLRNAENELIGILGIGRDITERKAAEELLSMTKFSIEQASFPIMWVTSEGRFHFVNDAACRMYGYSKEDFGNLSAAELNKSYTEEVWRDYWQKLKEKKSIVFETINVTKGNREIAVEVNSNYLVYNNQEYNCAYILDITERKKHEAELHRVANHDMVTGLPNRRLLTDRLEQAVVRTRRNRKNLAVCYLDIDDFKPVNDMYGHAVGDQLLLALTQQLKGVLRAEDTLARLGGDEFVLLFNELENIVDVQTILNRVHAIVSTKIRVEYITFRLSASIGVALYPDDDVDPDALLRHADQAMYIAKRAGKNQYHIFDTIHDREAQQRLDNLQQLRMALEKNEFVLHYQPKVNLLSGRVIGAEALIRWQHPERGLLSPADFLHYLDGSDLEIAVGGWVIDSALKQIDAWNADGLSVPVSVNISAGHLLSVDFTARLHAMLDQHPNVKPGYLELEIVETAALSDMSQAVNTLTRCRELGVKISLDDFGTGYSPLTYLRQLPVDILKIDQSFVRDMLTDPSDRGIVISVIQLAKTFDRTVIAEGVETLEQGIMLINLGCRIMQGYGIARPMPAQEIPNWLNQWRAKAVWQSLNT